MPGNRKGAVVITESMLAMGLTMIGIILLVITFNAVFGGQARGIEDTALVSMAVSLENYIERVAASSGSVSTVYRFPAGINVNVTISNKEIELSYANATRNIKIDFASQLNAEGIYRFYSPRELCIVKNGYDNRIFIFEGRCVCNINDRICDPACVASDKCDPRCYKPESDGLCNSRCIVHGDGICDPDCIGNNECDSDCSCRPETTSTTIVKTTTTVRPTRGTR